MSPMRILFALLFAAPCLCGAGLRAGVGRAEITPSGPIWMSGYAARTHASEGVLTPLWAKALAIESGPGARIVIVTADVVGIPRVVADEVAARAENQYGIRRQQLILNASHTHTGPVLWPNLINMTEFSPAEREKLVEYQHRFEDGLVAAIGAAVRDMAPATAQYGEGSAAFAVNRRQHTATGVKIGVNPDGPGDHSVPVLKISGADGKVRAILFGYACHNTTLTEKIYQLSGDYAGFAAAELERRHPQATALFLMLCGADQNPNPRGTVELAQSHGSALAAEVDRVISQTMRPVNGPIRGTFRRIDLELAPRTRADLEAELTSKVAAQARRARMILTALDSGQQVNRIEYPIQAVRFGHTLTLVALGGEVTVEYALRIKGEYTGEPIVVAGYSNDVMCYIPSARVLSEGGYEANDSMIYYGQIGPFAADVEDRIFAGLAGVMRAVGRRAAPR